MQSWPDPGQNGTGGQTSWQGAFPYGQDGQFDANQTWQQSVADHAASFPHLGNTPDAHTQNFFNPSPHQGDAFLGGNLHPPQTGDPNFHGALGLSQEFSQAGQDVIDPAFSNLHPDLYSQQTKGNLSLSQEQAQNHGHGQSFQQHDFQFPAQHEQAFNPPVSQYSSEQLLSRTPSQHNHSSVQHFDGLQGGFQQEQAFSRHAQQSPSVLHQQPFSHAQGFVHNGQPSHFAPDPNPHITYQQQRAQPQSHVQQPLDPGSFAVQKLSSYSQPGQGSSTGHQAHLAGIDASMGQPVTSSLPEAMPVPVRHTSSELLSSHVQPSPMVTADSTQLTKRKRMSKTSIESPTPMAEVPSVMADLSGESSVKRAEDLDSLPIPEPSTEEARLMVDFGKRNKTAQAKYPTIRGLPHMVYEGTVKLPAPKSYDKMSPLVALPARSGRPIAPEMGYSLPCEVQGRFTSKYRPSFDKSGLDERRAEAKYLLDEYDRSMRSLGKRQPKYTEYPHAFKEQLKSDEASKNKAEKKAKKELEDERNKPVRSVTRPADPIEAVVWDTIGIVHVDQATQRTTSLIAGRVQQAGEFFVKLRTEMNRSKLDLEEAITSKQPEAVIEKKKAEAEQKKEALYRALDATVEHADDGVLDNLGGHQKLVLSLVNVLISSIKATDFSGKLPKIVLELFTHFRITKKIVETTNFDSVRKRLEDKGDDEVKQLVREISIKIKKFQKANEPTTATGYTGTSASSRARAGGKQASDGVAAKRGRDEDVEVRTVKKIAVEAGAGSLSKKLGQPKVSQSLNKIAAAKQATSSVLPGKPRPIAKILAKTEAVGADSPNVSADDKDKTDMKKPIVKTENKPGAPKTEAKVPTPKSAPSSASALSGIASLLDSINAKKPEVVPVTSKDSKSPDSSETPEQRAKRIRKEGRRKLRVSWKPEGELVQVRIFQKGDEEDEGRDVNMIRDAGDDRSEGMVLKQRADVDEDEDDDDIPYQPWIGPTATDFSDLPSDVRNKNYVTRGGNITFKTDEQTVITERGQRELMAIYTDVDDIPPSPKSPPPESSSPANSKAGYIPTEGANFEELQLRWRDEQNMGLEQALGAALRRIDAKHNPSNKLDDIFGRLKSAPDQSKSHQTSSHLWTLHGSSTTQHNFPFAVGPGSEEQVLACLEQEKIATWRDPNPIYVDPTRSHQYGDANLQMIGNHIESVARSLAGLPFPATAPPEWLAHDAERVREWWLGFNKEVAAKQRKSDEELARSEAEANAMRLVAGAPGQTPSRDWNAYYQQQQQQQSYAPYLALLQQMTGGQVSGQAQASPSQGQQGAIPDSQLQSILSAINQSQQQQAQAQASGANTVANLNPSDASYQQLMMLTQLAQQGQQQGQPPPPPPPLPSSSERDWDRSERDAKDARKKKTTLPPHKPANKALIGTKACTFWQQGKCARGDKCTFRHDTCTT